MNQSINDSMQSMNESINVSINQAINQSINQSIRELQNYLHWRRGFPKWATTLVSGMDGVLIAAKKSIEITTQRGII